jgi:hypothetical protein
VPDRREIAIAQNEALFRDVNDRRVGEDPGLIAFTCECGHLDCHAQVRLEPADYHAIREHDRHFFVLPGHDIEDVESVVEKRDTHWVIEKPPELGPIVER